LFGAVSRCSEQEPRLKDEIHEGILLCVPNFSTPYPDILSRRSLWQREINNQLDLFFEFDV
jgi:hypothetical protein